VLHAPIVSCRYGPSDKVVVIEANTTSTYSLIPAGGSLTVKACAKWDFQLYSVSPILPNGVYVFCSRVCASEISRGIAQPPPSAVDRRLGCNR
jgi:hypothetical protein